MRSLNLPRPCPAARRPGFLLLLALTLLATACAEFRGLPTHGGGKRFDEEERIVAGAIRRALADMDLKELHGRNISVQLESISHSGGGYITFPGIQNFNGNIGLSENNSLNRYLVYPPPGQYLPYGDSRNNSDGMNYGAGFSGSFATSYNATTLGSDPDLAYLRSALTMKAQHCGLNVVGANPDCLLYVLVDVLGTNRSRDDSFLFWTDRLVASCELTYYAQDAKTGRLIFRARHTSADGEYQERSIIGLTAYRKGLSIESTPGTTLAVDGEEVAASVCKAKAVKKCVKKKGVLVRLLTRENTNADATTTGTVEVQSVRKFLSDQLANAWTQLQLGNLAEAARLLDTVRAVKPDYPGLSAADADLARRKQQAQPPAAPPPLAPQQPTPKP